MILQDDQQEEEDDEEEEEGEPSIPEEFMFEAEGVALEDDMMKVTYCTVVCCTVL